jgi:DNA-directed RNA polymerase subunit RPC12/RpoP
MNNKNICMRCKGKMVFKGRENIQLGRTGFFLGDLPNLFTGAQDVNIYVCENCGKIEFYSSEKPVESTGIAQGTCPKCGTIHDIDYPKCPSCGYRYQEL